MFKGNERVERKLFVGKMHGLYFISISFVRIIPTYRDIIKGNEI